MALLKIHNLTVAYRSIPVLEDFTLEIPEGDFLAVIGPNGSGKTTLLKTLAKVLGPAAGAIYINDQDLRKINRRYLARQMGVVPQDDAVTFEFTIAEMVLMGRTAHLTRWQRLSEKDRAVVEHAMRATDVWRLRDRLITQISGGERKRVVIARALAQQPRLLLLDEPTSNLDLNYQEEILSLCSRLNIEQQMTVLLVIHDIHLAAQFAKRVVLLDEKGRIHAVGTPSQVITEANISAVYHTDISIAPHPVTGRPSISLKGRRKHSGDLPRVHVICGGGMGKSVLQWLVEKGFHVSAGALNEGDADCDVAQALGLQIVSEVPFKPLGEGAHGKTVEALNQADLCLLAKVPFGTGNLVNLSAILESKIQKVFILSPADFSTRDYTHGKAGELLEQIMQQKDVVLVEKEEDLAGLLPT